MGRMHRYRAAHEQEGEALPMGLGIDMLSTNNPTEVEEETDTPIYEKYDALLHGSLRNKKDKIVSMKFMKKYIHIAKSIKPVLSREASETIAEEYSRLRSQDTEHTDMARTQPVTPRALETLIRLSTAHAKARLSRTVECEDAEAAIEMVTYAYFKKVMEKKKKKSADDGDDTETEGEEESTEPRKRKRTDGDKKKAKRPRKQPGEDGYDPYDVSQSEEEFEEDPPEATPASVRRSMEDLDKTATTQKEISAPRLAAFKTTLTKLFKEERSQTAALGRLKEFLKTEHPEEPFTDDEVDAAIQKMTDANQIMVADDMLFLI